MIGRFYSFSRDLTHRDVPADTADTVGEGLTDYACPACGATQYQLVFRVDALTHRAALIVECGSCCIREDLKVGHTAVA